MPIRKCKKCGKYTEEEFHCGSKTVEILGERERIRLSKLLAYILRHNPWKFGLRPDKRGWVKIDDLLVSIKEIFPRASKDAIIGLATLDEKGRYEIFGDKIRARYGHSFPVKIEYEEDKSSEVLFHGTSSRFLGSILREGIKAMRRNWVHLSPKIEDAIEVGKRHGEEVVILEVDCECLRKKGLKIYFASDKVRLVRRVPPECITNVLYPHRRSGKR